MAQSNPSRYRFSKSSGRSIPAVLAAPPIDVMAVQELRAQRQAAMARVNMLQQERNRQTKCLEQLRETLKNLRVDNHTRGEKNMVDRLSISSADFFLVSFEFERKVLSLANG